MKVEKKKLKHNLPEGAKEEHSTPLRLGDILDRIVQVLTTYIKLPSDGLAMLIACWIAGTYCYERYQYYGYLAIRSATPRCGKSQLLKLIALLCAGTPPVTSNPTAAVLYRNPRKIVILDEIDHLRTQDKETHGDVIGVLNAGFERGSVIERMGKKAKGGYKVEQFDVYGPKAIAGIEQVADTIADRTFSIVLKRVTTRPPRFRVGKLEGELARLRTDLASWINTHEAIIETSYRNLPDSSPVLEGFDDRFQDIAEPLVVLAMLADEEGEHRPKVIEGLRDGLTAAAMRREPTGREGAFRDFLNLADSQLNGHQVVFIPTEELVEECEHSPELSWIHNGASLAGLLRRFDLVPSNNGRRRGYRIRREWVDEWRERYPKPPTDEEQLEDLPPVEEY